MRHRKPPRPRQVLRPPLACRDTWEPSRCSLGPLHPTAVLALCPGGRSNKSLVEAHALLLGHGLTKVGRTSCPSRGRTPLPRVPGRQGTSQMCSAWGPDHGHTRSINFQYWAVAASLKMSLHTAGHSWALKDFRRPCRPQDPTVSNCPPPAMGSAGATRRNPGPTLRDSPGKSCPRVQQMTPRWACYSASMPSASTARVRGNCHGRQVGDRWSLCLEGVEGWEGRSRGGCGAYL